MTINITQETIKNRDMPYRYPFVSAVCPDENSLLELVKKYSGEGDFVLSVDGLNVEVLFEVNLAEFVSEDVWRRVEPYRSGDVFAEAEYIIGMEFLKASLERIHARVGKMVFEQLKNHGVGED